MNIKFKHVYAKNFMSFRNLDFDIYRFNGQTVLISGCNDDICGDFQKSNGSGKSTLHNSIIFALYGELLNPLKKSAGIRSWANGVTTKDDVEVKLTIESGDKEYVILRILKGKRCAGELHVYSKEIGVDCDYDEITLSTMSETQQMIERDIVHCTKEGFLRCVILTADQNYDFFKLSKSAKDEFFESLLDLTKYTDMYNKLHRITLDTSNSLNAVSRSIDKLNDNIVKISNEKDEYIKNQESVSMAKKEYDKVKNELAIFEQSNELFKITADLKTKLKEFQVTETERAKKALSKYDAENGISDVNGSTIIFNSARDSDVVKKAMDEYDSINHISLDDHGNVLNILNEISHIREKKSALETRIRNGESELKKLVENIFNIKTSISSLKSDFDSNVRKIDDLKNIMASHSKITNILCKDCAVKYINSVDISSYPEEIAKIEKHIMICKDKIGELTATLDDVNTRHTKYESAIDKLKSELDSLRKIESDNENDRKRIISERESHKKMIISGIKNMHDSIQLKRNQLRSELAMSYREELIKLQSAVSESESAYKSKHDDLIRRVKAIEYAMKSFSDIGTSGFDSSIKTLTDTLNSETEKFNILTGKISHYRALEEVIKPENIRKIIVPDMLKDLNFRICGYLTKMGSNYTCEFNDEFDPFFVSSNGTVIEYNNFSSGEKMRLSIACCLAFRDFMQVRLNIHPNILMIDEYIDSNIDTMAVSGIMDMIHYMVGTEHIAAFIISHRNEIKQDTFDSEIIVRKKNNESSLIINGLQTN